MVVCKGSAGLIALAVERQIIVMPFTIVFVVSQVLKKLVSVRVRISFAHAIFNRVGPAGDVSESFARLQNRSDFFRGFFLIRKDAILPTV